MEVLWPMLCGYLGSTRVSILASFNTNIDTRLIVALQNSMISPLYPWTFYKHISIPWPTWYWILSFSFNTLTHWYMEKTIPAHQQLWLLPGLTLGRCNPQTESLLLHGSPAHKNHKPYAQASKNNLHKLL
jgi:hypothetical protein